MLLETLDTALARGARIYAEVLGYGLNCDADHMVAPNKASIARCIRLAHRNAGVDRPRSTTSARTAPAPPPTTSPRRPRSARCSDGNPPPVQLDQVDARPHHGRGQRVRRHRLDARHRTRASCRRPSTTARLDPQLPTSTGTERFPRPPTCASCRTTVSPSAATTPSPSSARYAHEEAASTTHRRHRLGSRGTRWASAPTRSAAACDRGRARDVSAMFDEALSRTDMPSPCTDFRPRRPPRRKGTRSLDRSTALAVVALRAGAARRRARARRGPARSDSASRSARRPAASVARATSPRTRSSGAAVPGQPADFPNAVMNAPPGDRDPARPAGVNATISDGPVAVLTALRYAR